jgi:hypothetical protein
MKSKRHIWPDLKPEERAYWNMFCRCYNPGSQSYYRYGERGIYVCARWTGPAGLALFLADLGPRPSDEYSLDRIDNDGIYEPGNCRWATAKEQSNNKSNNVSRIGHAWERG